MLRGKWYLRAVGLSDLLIEDVAGSLEARGCGPSKQTGCWSMSKGAREKELGGRAKAGGAAWLW